LKDKELKGNVSRLKKRNTLFGKLLFVFFGAAFAIGIAWIISFRYFADEPYKKSFNKNIITYTRLIADKMRFDPLAKSVIEKAAGVNIITNRYEIISLINKKDLHFKRLTSYISVTQPSKLFYVLYENNFDFFMIRVQDQEFHPEKLEAALLAFVLALIILFITYKKVQSIFRPVDKIQKKAIEYGKGHFDELIPVEGDGQLAELTISINDLVIRVSSMLNAKRDLLLAIGHELKTPLARLRMQIEMLDNDQPEMVENIKEMTSIIDSLLEAERVSHHSDLNTQMMDLSSFIKQYESDGVEVITESELLMEMDPIRMDLALKNLINNAYKYSGDNPTIVLKLNTDQKELWVTDSGPGVEEKNLQSLTEAFYRPDEARSRDQGGVGLGLYLVNNIVQAHKGELEFVNMNPGLRVIIKFS
jgi:signal transduction histidine kinase